MFDFLSLHRPLGHIIGVIEVVDNAPPASIVCIHVDIFVHLFCEAQHRLYLLVSIASLKGGNLAVPFGAEQDVALTVDREQKLDG